MVVPTPTPKTVVEWGHFLLPDEYSPLVHQPYHKCIHISKGGWFLSYSKTVKRECIKEGKNKQGLLLLCHHSSLYTNPVPFFLFLSPNKLKIKKARIMFSFYHALWWCFPCASILSRPASILLLLLLWSSLKLSLRVVETITLCFSSPFLVFFASPPLTTLSLSLSSLASVFSRDGYDHLSAPKAAFREEGDADFDGGSWRCRQDYHPLQAKAWRDCYNNSHYR